MLVMRLPLTIATPVTVTSSTPSKKRNYTTEQREYLESVFRKTEYPDRETIESISRNLGLLEGQIRNWFTNKRHKNKTKASVDPPPRPPPVPPNVTIRNLSSSSSFTPQAIGPVLRSVPPFPPSLGTGDREETPSADGILGSVKYRAPTQAARTTPVTKTSTLMERTPLNKGDSGSKMKFFGIARELSSLITGGFIARLENIHPLVNIMPKAGDNDGRKYILNAINSTTNKQILNEFAKTSGPAEIVEWIKDAKKEMDTKKGVGDKRQLEIMLKVIQILTRIPSEHRDPEFVRVIKSLTNDQAYPADVVTAAWDLLVLWGKAEDRYGSRSGTDQADARKRTRTNPTEPATPTSTAPVPATTSTATATTPAASVATGAASTATPATSNANNTSTNATAGSSTFKPSALAPKSIKPKKVVRFKAAHELVAIKYIESHQDPKFWAYYHWNTANRHPDDDDHSDDDDDYYSDEGDQMDEGAAAGVHYQDQHGHQEYEHAPQEHIELPPIAPPPVVVVPVLSTGPAFRMPEEVIQQAISGELWQPPRQLQIEHPYDESHYSVKAEGEESDEKMIQATREDSVPAVHYSDLESIPPTPTEPDEDVVMEPKPPIVVPLFDESVADPGTALHLTLLSIYQTIKARSEALQKEYKEEQQMQLQMQMQMPA
ncbi:hypothetical protein BGX23_008335 [Mortierella sp. AD031]|nr:hypothetical protein BGX23_008335 [Mortierella sp. AD031]